MWGAPHTGWAGRVLARPRRPAVPPAVPPAVERGGDSLFDTCAPLLDSWVARPSCYDPGPLRGSGEGRVGRVWSAFGASSPTGARQGGVRSLRCRCRAPSPEGVARDASRSLSVSLTLTVTRAASQSLSGAVSLPPARREGQSAGFCKGPRGCLVVQLPLRRLCWAATPAAAGVVLELVKRIAAAQHTCYQQLCWSFSLSCVCDWDLRLVSSGNCIVLSPFLYVESELPKKYAGKAVWFVSTIATFGWLPCPALQIGTLPAASVISNYLALAILCTAATLSHRKSLWGMRWWHSTPLSSLHIGL